MYSKADGQASESLNGSAPGLGPTGPAVENLKLIDPEQIRVFLHMLFRHVAPGIGAVHFRGIGEQSTRKEGKHHENLSLPLDDSIDGLMPRVLEAAKRWGQHHIATLILPAVMDRSILIDNK